MKPFDNYHEDGTNPLPVRSKGTARHDYGLDLQVLTKQTTCAYCDTDLTADFNSWLLLSVDHVIPTSECKRLRIPISYSESYSNLVLCCLGCNGLNNRYRVSSAAPKDNWSLNEILEMRALVFEERKREILVKRQIEKAFFDKAPWKNIEGE